MHAKSLIIFCQVLTHYLLSSYWKYVLFVFSFMKAIWQSGVCYFCSAPLCPNIDESFGISLFWKGGNGGSS